MAIRGSLREASLPDVLQLLSLGKKTGCLSVAHRNSFGYIYFEQGRISYASIVNRRDRLGDILVKNGVITQAQLDAAIDAQRMHRDVRLGELLVAQRALTREALTQHVRLQIEEAVYFLFTWTEGTFNFEPDVAPEQQDIIVSINPESLLLEGARRVDEWSLIEKKVPSFDIIFELDRAKLQSTDIALEDDQRRVVELVDGQRDVAQIVEDSGLGEFDVGKALYGLATAGFVHRIGKTRPAQPSVSDTKVDEHRNLGVAFYRTGMYEEALREFRRVRELREQDQGARFHEGLIQLRQGAWEDAARTFADASLQTGARPAVFHNLAFALESLGRYADARAALEEALRRGGNRDPRIHTSLAAIALRQGDAAQADAEQRCGSITRRWRLPCRATSRVRRPSSTRGSRSIRASRRCTTPAPSSRSGAATSSAPSRRSRKGSRRTPACRSSTRTWATASIARGAMTRRSRRTGAP